MKLRGHLRQKCLRQAELANALEMTPSAVSQILSGKIVPTQAVFDRIAEILALPCDETVRLQSMLLGIRLGMNDMPSPLNRRIFTLRCQSGASLDEIRRLCGISVERMKQLENDSSAVPTATERGILTTFFGTEIDPENATYASRNISSRIEVAERRTEYRSDFDSGMAFITLLSPADFAEFRTGVSLSEYLVGRNQNFVTSEFSPQWCNPVVVQGDCEMFHLKSFGRIRVIVVDERSVEKPAFAFCGDGRGNYFLRGDRKTGFPLVSDQRFRAVWRLPVVDISFRPIQKAGTREGDE